MNRCLRIATFLAVRTRPFQSTFIEPCIPVLKTEPPVGPNWIHEVKFDGWRVQIHSSAGTVQIYSRNGNDLTSRFPAAVKLPPCIIDAEVVADDANGGHDFYTLLRNNVPLSFWCFDLLSLRGKDVRLLPLGTRRARLRQLLPSGPLHFSEAFADPHALLQKAAQYLLEGIVSKRVDLPYRSGKRPEWVKVKAQWWREANSDRWEKMRG